MISWFTVFNGVLIAGLVLTIFGAIGWIYTGINSLSTKKTAANKNQDDLIEITKPQD
jgi:hypothetical protein